jgi:hypothetical protein
MTERPVCLTLVAPRRLRDELFDYLSEQTELVSGLTASDAAGHGAKVRLHTAAERVKGHADQVVVRMVLPGNDAVQLIEQLRISFAGTRLVYWTMPVTEFGIIE